jgi:peptidoglycan/LPS O-acetylase OafA/YrhL
VVLFHFGVPGLHAGFMGVDIFFVISGFLMTAIIVKGTEAEFSILSFYWSRTRRIVPALLALCVLLLALSWFFMPSADFSLLGKHVFASLLFISNLVYWREAGYFDVASHEKWLLHTWSLSVEWQFYLLYPLFILAVLKLLSPRWLVRLLALCTVASFALCLWLSNAQGVAAFYSLPSRVWELTLGGLVFLMFRHAQLSNVHARVLEGIGFVLMGAGLLLIADGRGWPDAFALLPVLGAACVLSASRQGSLLTGNAPLQWLGLRSYSVYLWHWPIVVGTVFLEIEPGAFSTTVGILLALVLGELSYRWVEQPSQRLLSPARRQAVVSVLAGVAVVAGVGIALRVEGGAGWRLPPMINTLTQVDFDRSSYRDGTCFLKPEQRADAFATCDDGGGAEQMVLWGDSHAAHLYPGLLAAKHTGQQIIQRTANSCPPIIGKDFPERPYCKATNDAVMASITEHRPQVVLLAANWVNHDWREVAATIQALKKAGVERIALIGPVPQWRGSLPSYLEKHYLVFNKTEFPARVPTGTRPEIFRLDAEMRAFADSEAVSYISPTSIFCDSAGCLAFVDTERGKPSLTALDYSHLTVEGSEYLVSKFPEPFK